MTDVKIVNRIVAVALIVFMITILFIWWCVTQPVPEMISNTTTITYNITYVNITNNCCNCTEKVSVTETPFYTTKTYSHTIGDTVPVLPTEPQEPAIEPTIPHACEFPWWCD